MGIKEQIVFPEIDFDKIAQIRGMDITVTTLRLPIECEFKLNLVLGRQPKSLRL